MSCAEFTYNESFGITSDVKKIFDDKGYIIIRDLFDSTEVAQLKKAVEETDAITKYGQGVADGDGRETKISIWRHPGTDVTGMVARCEKMAGFSEKLLGGEVYHYHSKLMMKDAQTGGKHLWHQDYGYWYKNGIIFPDLLSVFIPVDNCVKENGCLQVLEGSHQCGRIKHLMVAGQTGADTERVAKIAKVCPLIYVELQAGDALFFHSNLLHTSNSNNSDMRRWAIISCYNRASNNPVHKHEYPQYTKLHKVPNSAIKECTNFTDVEGKEFVDLRKDKTVRVDQEIAAK